MPSLRERPEFELGRAGEQTVAGWLQHNGWYVVPSYDYAGDDKNKAPRLQGRISGYAIPDLDVARNGARFWVEVKVKNGPTLHRKSGRLEHGISKRLWEHYRKVEEITGTAVWIVVVEQDSGEMLVGALKTLGEPRIYEGWKMGEGGMAFWPREAFRKMTDRSAA
jgi:hypothetical protein